MATVFRHVRMGSLTPRLPTVFGDENDMKVGKNSGHMRSSRLFWGGMGQLASLCQFIFGLVLFVASFQFLMHSGKSTGQIIGGASCLLGVAGWFGNRTQKPQLQTLFVIGMGFLGLVTFEFIGQVGRDVEIHCNFAESYARIAHLEEKVTSLKHDEMVTQLFTRMNEMDDILDMVQSGTVDKLELRHKQQDLAGQDTKYIKSKIHALKKHADEVLDHVYSQAKQLDEAGKADPAIAAQQKEIRKNLEGHLDNVEAVLNHIQSSEDKNHQLTYEEYELLFNALMAGHTESENLKNEKLHLPWAKAAWERQTANEYHKYDLTQAGQRLKNAEDHRKLQREKFEANFAASFDDHAKLAKPHFEASLVSVLEDLPEHCLLELKHYKVIRYGCWLLILSQMLAAYISATSMVIWTQKKDT